MSMSTPSDSTPRAARSTVATYATYREAEQAVDRLSDSGFPVEQVTIVGTGLRYVEKVSGRVTTGRAALMGTAQGAMLGLLFGLLFGLFFTNAGDFFGVVLYGLIAGAVWGTLYGAFFHYAQGGRRDFGSTSETRADRYEVQVAPAAADQAARLLETRPVRAA
jgi:uncharacterized membrane protein